MFPLVCYSDAFLGLTNSGSIFPREATMTATIIRIEGLADTWSADVEVAGRSTHLTDTSLDAINAQCLTAYAELTAPVPEPVVAPVVEEPVAAPQPPAPVEAAPVDVPPAPQGDAGSIPPVPASDPAPAPVVEPSPEPVSVPASPEPAPVIEPETAEASMLPAPALSPVTVEMRAMLRSGLSEAAWSGLPQDDRDALIAEQTVFEGHA